MKFILIATLLSTAALAGETWEKTKRGINKGADTVDQKTREVIQKGKNKWNEREQKKKMDEQREEERDPHDLPDVEE